MVLFFLNVRIAGIFFENCTDCTDFKKMYGFKKKFTDCTDFFLKLYGFFFLKMYGFLYGFFQKSFGHPETVRTTYENMSISWFNHI